MVIEKERLVGQWNRRKNPEIIRHIGSNNFLSDCQDYSMGKTQSLQQMGLEKLAPTWKNKVDPYLMLHMKINLKQMKKSALRAKTIKLSKKTERESFVTLIQSYQ